MGRADVEPIASGRRQRALALLEGEEALLRRVARRVSICSDDADDAFQRAVLILLTKGPEVEPQRLAAWMSVVTRREALAVRRARERLLGRSLGDASLEQPGALACERPGPADCAEQRERVATAACLLSRLKPHERLALVLQAEGHSYAEICGLTGWTYTKTNRCLAEGRERLRQLGAMD